MVNSIVNDQDITIVEIMSHSREKEKKTFEKWQRKYEKEKKNRERRGY